LGFPILLGKTSQPAPSAGLDILTAGNRRKQVNQRHLLDLTFQQLVNKSTNAILCTFQPGTNSLYLNKKIVQNGPKSI
jgi:hypothetical protein